MSSKEVWFKPVKEIPKGGRGVKDSKCDEHIITPFIESDVRAVEVTLQQKGLAGYIRSRSRKRGLDKKMKVTRRDKKVYLQKI